MKTNNCTKSKKIVKMFTKMREVNKCSRCLSPSTSHLCAYYSNEFLKLEVFGSKILNG